MQKTMASSWVRRARVPVLLLTAFVIMGEIGSSLAEVCGRRCRHSMCWHYQRPAFPDHPCELFEKPFCPGTDYYTSEPAHAGRCKIAMPNVMVDRWRCRDCVSQCPPFLSHAGGCIDCDVEQLAIPQWLCQVEGS